VIQLLGSIPKKVFLAFSGGPDSVAVLDFLLAGRRDVTAVHFCHGTPHGVEALNFVETHTQFYGVPLITERIQRDRRSDESQEEYWRNERYQFLESLEGPVVTAHHLDDVLEWWIFTSLHGMTKLIPYRRNNVIRPFLKTAKETLVDWCDRKNLPYITDPGNQDERYMRSIVRHKIVPQAVRINPGVRTVLKKKIELEYKSQENEVQ